MTGFVDRQSTKKIGRGGSGGGAREGGGKTEEIAQGCERVKLVLIRFR